MMKILLTGATGQVGMALAPRLTKDFQLLKPPSSAAASVSATHLDLSNGTDILTYLNARQPDLIINAAAYTAVDLAEEEPERAFDINARGPAALAAWCAANEAQLLQLSTDYVFSGDRRTAYRETDPTGPLNVYGRSKLLGEQRVQESGCRHLILRTSWVYSPSGKNFVKTMLRLGATQDRLKIVADQIGRPTSADSIAAVIAAIVKQNSGLPESSGVYHYADAGAASWYDFALEIFQMAVTLGMLDSSPEIRAVDSSQFPQPAERPKYSVLNTDKIREQLNAVITPRTLALENCLCSLKARQAADCKE